MKPFCFSLSGIYESEGYAWEQAGKIWDLRELRGTDGYLDPETEQFLEAELGRKKETKELPRIRLLDSGNYHYMSKLLLGLEKEDLFLAVFDHHTDMQPPALLPVLSCGSWIRDAAASLFESVRFLTTAVASEMSYSSGLQQQALFSIALVLFLFILLINATLNFFLKRGKEA